MDILRKSLNINNSDNNINIKDWKSFKEDIFTSVWNP